MSNFEMGIAKLGYEEAGLEKRTKVFALGIIKFAATLSTDRIGDIIAGTSIGANYREANRAESRNDFIHKIAIVEKEASECQYWLELCDEARFGEASQRAWLVQECGELLAISTSSGRTAKAVRR